jgi:hypothetical protein
MLCKCQGDALAVGTTQPPSRLLIKRIDEEENQAKTQTDPNKVLQQEGSPQHASRFWSTWTRSLATIPCYPRSAPPCSVYCKLKTKMFQPFNVVMPRNSDTITIRSASCANYLKSRPASAATLVSFSKSLRRPPSLASFSNGSMSVAMDWTCRAHHPMACHLRDSPHKKRREWTVE